MVDDLGCVVEFRGGFTAVPSLQHDLFERHVFEVLALDLTVEVVEVSSVMLAIVELKGSL